MAIKKRPISPRQKMINLMYIVLLAMLALNVSSDVLKGFRLIGSSLRQTIEVAAQENKNIYDDLEAQMKKNPQKVKAWYDRAQHVRKISQDLYAFADSLRYAIARECDGREGNPDNLEDQENLEAASRIMLAPARGQGQRLYNAINKYREEILQYITDPRQRAIIEANLSTSVPRTEDNIGKNWQQYMFESMPSIAAVTMLSKLQSDVRKAENEVLHTLVSNIDLKDIRVNELAAYCLPEATTLFPGETFRSRIFMAAIDTTMRPEIYINGRKLESPDGAYSFGVGGVGEYSFSGYILMPNAAGELVRREFTQKYNVIAPPAGATVAADLMNVLYAGYENPISVSASGVPSNKISVSMSGGSLSAQGNGHYIAKPAQVGQDVTFTVTGEVGGKMQTMAAATFKVRKLPDPTAYINVNGEHFRGRRLAKAAILSAPSIGASIDDGLLNIPFRVLAFETVFFDRMGNVRPSKSSSANFTEEQKEQMRELRSGSRFYITAIRAIGPDGIERTLPSAMEVILK